MKKKEIKKEALEPVVASRARAVELAAVAEQAMKDARMAELEYKVQIQQMYLENGLEAECRVDISTGAVTWPDEIAKESSEESAEASTKSKRTAKKKTAKKAEPAQVEKKSA